MKRREMRLCPDAICAGSEQVRSRGSFGARNRIAVLVYSFCCLCGFSFVAQAQTTPVVTSGGGATEVASGTATLRGLMTEGVSATAYFCWGSQPGSTGSGADTGTWEHVSSAIAVTDGVAFSNAVSGLYYGIEYDYAVYAENGSGGTWSSIATFTTLPPENLWTPAQIACTAWYDASDAGTLQVDSSRVTNWQDKSGNAVHLAQATAAAQPQTGYLLNGLSAVYFSGSTNWMSYVGNNIDYGTGAPAIQAVYVAKPITEMKDGYVFAYSSGGTASGQVFANTSANNTPAAEITGRHYNGLVESDHVYTADSDILLVSYALAADATYGNAKFHINGTSTGVTANNSNKMNLDSGTPDLTLGANVSTGGGGSDTVIGEFLMFPSVLSDANRWKVEGYLADKWGLSLDGGHRYVTAAPLNPGELLSISNSVGTALSSSSGEVIGVLDAPQSVFTVRAYVSTTSNTTVSAWTNDVTATNMLVGTYTNVSSLSITGTVASLTPSTTYYYTLVATNAATNMWADSNGSFTTLPGASAPTVTTGGGAIAGVGTATLQGLVTAGGFGTAYVCWGDEDGGTSTGGWDHVSSAIIAVQDTTFSNVVSNLYYGIEYSYSVYVTNAAGTDWSSVATFSTLPPATALWTPADTNTLVWYDPSDSSSVTPASGTVTQLDDKSGNGNHVVSVGDPQTGPGRTINGLNVIDCDGSGDYLTDSVFGVPASGDIAIFMVAQIDGIDNIYDSLFSLDATGNDFQFDSKNAGQFDGQINVAGIGSSVTATGGPFTGTSIFNCNFDKSGAGVYNAFIDGFQVCADTTYSTALLSSQDLKLMANRAGNAPVDGAMGEVVIVEDVSDAFRRMLEGYLAHKWGVSLPGGHVYETAAPTAGATLSINNGTGAPLSPTSGQVTGTLDAPQSVFTVYAYVSTTSNTTMSAWTNDVSATNVLVGTYTNVSGLSVTGQVSSLSPGTTYYYTMMASNAFTNIWADSNASFTTLPGASAPTVTTNGGASVGVGTATLRGLLSAGSFGTAYFCWGFEEGGATTGEWDHVSAAIPVVQGAAFSNVLSEVYYGLAYSYRVLVTNSAGSDWSDVATFSTLKPDPTGTPLQVDFSAGTEVPLQSGWSAFAQASSHSYSNEMASDGTVDVGITGVSDWKDRAAITDGSYKWLSNLLSDGPILNFNGTMTVTLSDLSAGSYDIFTYHHETQYNGISTFDIALTDGVGIDVVTFSGAGSKSGSPSTITTAAFPIVSDGADVVLKMINTDTANYFMLNGFELTPHLALFDIANTTANPDITSAALSGTLDALESGLTVYAYISTNSNTTAQAWFDDSSATNVVVGTYANANGLSITGQVSSLTPETTYYYTLMATNAVTNIWASPAIAFTTLQGESTPVLTTGGGATGIGLGIATLRGLMTEGGTADAVICWGNEDGGTIGTGAWDHAVSVGAIIAGAAFSNTVSNLYYGFEYNYRVYATNGSGGAWSDVATFTTAKPDVTGTPLKVDFSAASSSPVQTGWNGFVQAASRSYADTMASDGTVDVSISGVSAWKDRSAITDGDYVGLSNLLRDGPTRNTNGTMTVTLSDLSAGTYDIVTYHHATQYDGDSTFTVTLTDSVGTDVETFSGAGSLGASPSTVTTSAFAIVSDGSDVVIRITNTDTAGHVFLNGFELTPYLALFAISNTTASAAATSAALSGTLDSLESGITVYAYVSTNSNTTAQAWIDDSSATNVWVGTYTNAADLSVTGPIGSLTGDTTYYYTLMVTNAVTNIWASPAVSFATTGLPVASTGGGAADVGIYSASLYGVLTGGGVADGVFCWGEVDGGTASTGAWEHAVAIGEMTEGVADSLLATGLSAETTYRYRLFVANAFGSDWSERASFQTLSTTSNWQEPGGVDDNWSTSANWAGGVPNAVDAAAIFLAGTHRPSGAVVIDSAITVGHLTVNEVRFGGDINTTFAGTGPITFDVSAGHATVSHLEPYNTYQRLDIPAAVLNSDLDVLDLYRNGIAFGSISGAGGLNISTGSVTVTSAGAGYEGDVTVSTGGTLNNTSGNGSPFGNGTTVRLQNGGRWSLSNIADTYATDRRLLESALALPEGMGELYQGALPSDHAAEHYLFITISGAGQLKITKQGMGSTSRGALVLADHPTTGPNPNTYAGGTILTGTADDNSDANSDLGQVIAAKNGAFGAGDVILQGNIRLTIGSGTTDTIDDSASLTIAGDPSVAIDPETGDGAFLLDMQANETVYALTINGVVMSAGTHGKTGSGAQFIHDALFGDSLGNGGTGVLTVLWPKPGTTFMFK